MWNMFETWQLNFLDFKCKFDFNGMQFIVTDFNIHLLTYWLLYIYFVKYLRIMSYTYSYGLLCSWLGKMTSLSRTSKDAWRRFVLHSLHLPVSLSLTNSCLCVGRVTSLHTIFSTCTTTLSWSIMFQNTCLRIKTNAKGFLSLSCARLLQKFHLSLPPT